MAGGRSVDRWRAGGMPPNRRRASPRHAGGQPIQTPRVGSGGRHAPERPRGGCGPFSARRISNLKSPKEAVPASVRELNFPPPGGRLGSVSDENEVQGGPRPGWHGGCMGAGGMGGGAAVWFGGNEIEQSQRLDIHHGVVIWW